MTTNHLMQPTPAAPAEAEVVLAIEHVSKKFCRDLKRSMLYGARDIATEVFGGRRSSDTLRPGEFWALQDISFKLRRGEALGLVGHNGAGKSTLLRLISGLIKLDGGRITQRGRLAPLIALGAGFNPVLTGRENVHVNMAILGLTRSEIEARFEQVLEFAAIGDAIDSPVQTYSSGMAARLGFACAIHTEPDVLLIDEVLAVGDQAFRDKCFRKLASLRERGTAFVLVSHNPIVVMSMCKRAVFLNQGRLVIEGPTEEVMAHYEASLPAGAGTLSSQGGELVIDAVNPDADACLTAIGLRNEAGEPIDQLTTGQPGYIQISGQARRPINGLNVSLLVRELNDQKSRVVFLESSRDGHTWNVPEGDFSLRVKLPPCGLMGGLYSLKVHLLAGEMFNVLDTAESFAFKVDGKDQSRTSLFYQPRIWEFLA